MEIQDGVETEEVQGDEAAIKAEENKMREALLALSKSLLEKRDYAVRGRAACGVEQRWREDQASFDGLDPMTGRRPMMDYATGEALAPGRATAPNRSKVVANIARSKCETAHGRFCDILFPVDDKNWGIKPTPVPELTDKLLDDSQAAIADTNEPITAPDGTPVKISDVAKSDIEKAKKAASGMETEIDDQLTECSFNAQCRDAAWDAIVLGNGFIKGPDVVKRIKKSWIKQVNPETGASVYVMKAVEEMKPTLIRVDPRRVFPDPDCGEDLKKAGYIWEYDTVLPRDLIQLIGVDGYFEDQIRLVLDDEPIRTAAGTAQDEYKVNQSTIDKGSAYERWTYNGDIERKDLEAMGCDCSDSPVLPLLSASVVFVNDRPVKVVLNTLDTGDMIYDTFQWTKVSGSIWGIGIPRIQHHWDRVLTGVWRTMIDNAGDSAGSNIVFNEGIEPADGRWEITGKKAWITNGEIDDVRKAVFQWQTLNNQDQLQKIIELALRFIDMETGLPMLFQGEKAEAPETLGATNIMVDANNVALRGRVKRWDDDITRPAITRMYHYNMQYSPKDEIKEDYNVDARGTSVLLARDSQTNALGQAWQLMGDPDVAAVVDKKKAVRLFFQNQHLDILKEEADIQKAEAEKQKQMQAGPPPDPRVAGQIEVARTRAQGELERAQMVQAADDKEMQFRAAEAEKERQFKLMLAEKEERIEMMRLSQKSGETLEKIKADLTMTAKKLDTQERLSGMKQITTPPTEPVQHAPDGRAYEE